MRRAWFSHDFGKYRSHAAMAGGAHLVSNLCCATSSITMRSSNFRNTDAWKTANTFICFRMLGMLDGSRREQQSLGIKTLVCHNSPDINFSPTHPFPLEIT